LTGSPGFDRVTGSISILKKIQNGVFLVKKKNQRVATGFFIGFCRVNPPGHIGS